MKFFTTRDSRESFGRIGRTIRRWIACTVAACMVIVPSAISVAADAGQQPIELPPVEEVVCASYYVFDITKQEVLLEKEPNTRIYPASMTKIMTLALVLEHLNPDDYVTVSQSAMDATTPRSTMMGLKVGETIQIRELLYGAMLPSGNDAANVLGESVAQAVRDKNQTNSGKSLIDDFVDLMNAKTNELGLQNTHFMNTNGLHHDEHYTTARELAELFEYALQFDEFRTVINTPTHAFKKTNMHTFDGWSIARNTNYLLNDPWLVGADSHVAQIVGGKTGTTIPAGTGMALLAVNKNGDEMITVVCGIPYDICDRQTTYVAAVLRAGSIVCFNADPVVRVEGNVMNNRAYNAPDGMGPETPQETTPVTEPSDPGPTQENTDPPKTTAETTRSDETEEEDSGIIGFFKNNMLITILGGVALLFILAIVFLVIIPSGVRKSRRKKRRSGFQGIRRI
ncbi:MAG: serine hydrolase [Oscillospiraceae bacterium]|nr:serine hydrolase [Oscillospiraceae bacterium]